MELDRLARAVRGARAGESSCTLVVGEGGVGKTRLLQEAIASARQLGVGVTAGRAPISAPAPFCVITEALRSWLRAYPLSPMESPFDQGLRLVLPEWQVPSGAAADLDASQLQLLAQEGVVRLLRRIGESGRGVLLVLDDLHAADPDSLDIVRYVSAAAIEGVAIVGALRPGETPLADALVRGLRSSASAVVIELEPLEPRAVGDLIASLLDAVPPTEMIADVLARTDGVPLLIEEVVDAHVRSGSVQLDAGNARWRGGGLVVPLSIRGMVQDRLEPLPARLRDVLLAAAVLARLEPASLVARVAECNEEIVDAAFARGVDAGLLATRAGAIAFRHEVIREAVLDLAIPSRVAAMHLRAADALAGISDASRAGHLAAAGRDDEAAELFATAAASELRAHALLGAERLARQALEVARESTSRAAAADALAAVLAAQGRWAEALAIDEATVSKSGETEERLHRMASAALEAGYPERAHALLRGVAQELPLTRVLAGRVALVGGDAPAALAASDAVIADDGADTDTTLAALDIRARALDFAGDRAGAEHAWTRQAALAAATGRTQAELRAVFQLGKQQFFAGGPPVRLQEAVDLARGAGALVELAWAEELSPSPSLSRATRRRRSRCSTLRYIVLASSTSTSSTTC